MVKNLSKVTPGEIKKLVKLFINRNAELQTQGQLANTLCFTGPAGIAKTSSIIQVTEEEGIPYAKVNLANIDEAGDLIGFPIKEYELVKNPDAKKQDDVEVKWVSEKEYDFAVKAGWHPTGQNRTGYAPPAWLSKLQGSKGKCVLILDDWNRCHQHFMNCIMEILDRHEYYSWKLPQGCTIILTGNPAGEEYMTTEIDEAHATRFFNYNTTFSIEDWAYYAEKQKLDQRCINFFLKYHQEVMTPKGEKKRTAGDKYETNPRQWTKFFNAIGFIKDFSSKDSLELIQLIGQGIVGEYVNQFVTFINQKLDRLITPEEIMNDKLENVTKSLKSVIGDIDSQKGYNPEIASIIATRLTNWLIIYSDNNPITPDIVKRIEALFTAKLFGEDLNFKLMRDLYASQDKGGVRKFSKLLEAKAIREVIAK